MTRLGLASAVLAVATACALAGLGPAGERTASAAPPGPPNIVHILTDDQTVDSMRYMPLVEKLLARRGTTFSNYHATDPLCCPSRATFLTGQYAHNHGVLANDAPFGYGALDFSDTLYTAMHDAGYRTGWIGKVLNPTEAEQGTVPEPGFDEWFVPLEHSQQDMFNYKIGDNGTTRQYRGRYQNTVYSNEAERFLEGTGDEPFMLTISPFTPHWNRCPGGTGGRCPPAPAKRDLGDFDGVKFPYGPDFPAKPGLRAKADTWWDRELESLQSVDRMVEDVVDILRSRGELGNTLLIYQSDNGLMHGERGIKFQKNVPWDRSFRVPLVIRGPGFEPGAKRTDLTANVDVPATILDAAGVAPPLPPDGYSLLGDHVRRALLGERLRSRGPGGTWQQIKTSRGFTYWRATDGTNPHLYDLRRDPHQIHDLVAERPDLVARFEQRLEQIVDCADPCP